MLTHRAYAGWVTDVTSQAQYGPWPAVRLDEALLADYAASFALQQRLGLDLSVIWGLFVSSSWPVDLDDIPAERVGRVRRLLDLAHGHGVRVLAGLGVHSWGFEEVIRARPDLSAGNPRTLCPSNPAWWEWQRRLVDWLFDRAPLDGVSLQSADQGRCPCERCARWGAVEYHARLNARVAAYVKDRRPDAVVGVNAWGLSIEDPADLPHLLELARGADFFIDVFGSAARRDPAHRRRVAAALAAMGVAYGTNGGPSVRPPQHWQRLRWFLPCLREPAGTVARLAADGGRAIETFNQCIANPGDEVSLWVSAALFREPERPVEGVLDGVLDELYRPRGAAAREALAGVFLGAERAFFGRWRRPEGRTLVLLEPLRADRPGEPQYLTAQLAPEALPGYERDLLALRDEVDRLVPEVGAQERLRLVGHCLDGALGDVAHALRTTGAIPSA
jgi:hypothetical protein